MYSGYDPGVIRHEMGHSVFDAKSQIETRNRGHPTYDFDNKFLEAWQQSINADPYFQRQWDAYNKDRFQPTEMYSSGLDFHFGRPNYYAEAAVNPSFMPPALVPFYRDIIPNINTVPKPLPTWSPHYTGPVRPYMDGYGNAPQWHMPFPQPEY